MKLSIGMIVKNEEKYLEQCLTAIKPILNRVESELIITDTGSIDRTVEIAKGFTDKVLHFEWINDFSAARNTAFSIAQGEWFMYLDADEIFESCEEIISFFNSGEYRKYNSASYIVKNIVDSDGHFVVNKVPRLTRILKDTRFKNVVHELLTTYHEPKKDLMDAVIHYGYLYENEEQYKEKTKRNRALLLQRLQKEKDNNAYIYVQLAENEDDIQNAIKYIDEGVKIARKLNSISIIPLYKLKANLYLSNKQYEESLKVCSEYFSLEKRYRPSILTTDVEVLSIQACCHYLLKQFDKAVETYEYFFSLYDKYKCGKINSPDSDIVAIQVASESNYLSHAIQFIKSAIETNQYSLADDFITNLNVTHFSNGATHIDRLIDEEIKVLDYFNFKKTYEYYLKHDEKNKQLFRKKLESVLFYSTKKDAIIEALRIIPESSQKAALYEKYFNCFELKLNDLISFVEYYGNDKNPDIIMIAMKSQYDISQFIDNHRYNVKQAVFDGYSNVYGFHKAADNYDINKIDSGSLINAVNYIKYCMDATVDFKSPKPGVYVIINANRLIEKFGMLGKRIEQENSGTSSDIIQAAVVMGKALDYRNNKQYRECIAELKNVVHTCSSLAKFVSDYSNEVIAEFNDVINSQKREMSEMERLAVAIKGNIRKFIASGNITAAQKTLADYKAISPNDAEIPELEAAINSHN